MRSVRYITLFSFFILASCGSYKKNIMFKASDAAQPEAFKREAEGAEKNYVIQKNDLLTINVFTNKGERIIDPNPELTNSNMANMNNQQVQQFNYLVELNGVVKFPVIGEVKVDGLTLRQAEEMTQKEYAKYFKEPFTVISFVNKRVTVLGAPGGLVIPLTNQNITVVEVLALARGLSNDAKADNIKLIRNERIYQLDFSTIDGYRKSNMLVEPGDIIYVEPIRRPFVEGLRDNFIVVSLVVSLTTLLVLVRTLK
ncbi:MAG: polysaccharide biosynthesis/export family protein [Bacteroidota bacterium]|jgi:polysaccharide export outer membrane protein|nr:polysaccharide biosynthesis/export family protein [Cytophagales bacterium]